MAKIEIEGVGRFEVDDAFLSASPAVQQQTMAEIAASVSRTHRTQTLDVRGPDGSIYEVTAPEGASDDEIIAYAQSQAGRLESDQVNRGRALAGAPPKPHKPPVTATSASEDDPSYSGPGKYLDTWMKQEEAKYQANPQPEAVPASEAPQDADDTFRIGLQKLFDDGASLQKLRDFAMSSGGYGLPDNISDAIAYRDQGGKGTIVAPVKRSDEEGPGFVTRQLGSLNEGIADTLGAPVDIINSGMGAIGLPVSNKPFLGSESIRDGMHAIGIGQTGEEYAPRYGLEKYTQAMARGVGQSVIPAGGLPAAGGRAALLARASAPVATRAESLLAKVGQAMKAGGRTAAIEAAKAPGVAVAAELASGAGSGVGAQAGRDIAPDNPYAEIAGSIIGGLGGGLAAGRQVQKGLTPASRFANEQADNPFLAHDAVVSSDVERLVSAHPRHDANGRKLSKSVRAATLWTHVGELEKSYLPTASTINALDVAPSVKRTLKDAISRRRTLTPEELGDLRNVPHGDDLADGIIKVQRLRHYAPEAIATGAEQGLGGLIAETGAVAVGSKVGGPIGAAAARVGGRVVAGKIAGRGINADPVLALAGRASALRKLAQAQGIAVSKLGIRAIDRAANEAQDARYLARKASDARKAREAAENFSMVEGNRRLGIVNDRDNVRPQGGYRGYVYDRTGLLPADQDAGAMRMLAEGKLPPEQLEAFLSSPDKLQAGNAGNAIMDRLAAMADEGSLTRDPSWSPSPQVPAPGLQAYQDAQGLPIRNPLAYAATAKGNQDRVSQALASVRDHAELDDAVKEALGSTITKLGSTSSRIIANKLTASTLRKLPAENRDYARSILAPLVQGIKH